MFAELPIYEVLPEIKQSLLSNNTLILQAPPGAGKSTIIPIELLNEEWLAGRKLLMLEPRRLATRAVAGRMADLMDEDIGETVGYRIRFDNKTSSKTKVEVLTEGILSRILQQDNSLEGVGLVIFDEFHERSIHADLALALCREAQQVLREDLRILIMSATLDGEKLSQLLGNAPVISSKGRQYPVEIKYFEQNEHTPLPVQMSKAIARALNNEEGDVLAFFPGAGEIHRTEELLAQQFPGMKICPLYGDLPQKEQQAAIMPDPAGRRKVVLATSIAETSLTIEGIKVVVDCGYSRAQRFDPRSGLSKLETIRITKDAADQRTGRAGRLGPGIAYRLWSEGANHKLSLHRIPEILEADLAPVVLELANWGVDDMRTLSWLSPPPAGALAQAKELLRELEALNDTDRITAKGKEMLRLPTHPRIAHLILEGNRNRQSLSLATDIAALLEEKDPMGKDAGTDISLRVENLRKHRNNEYTNGDRRIFDRVERLAANWRRIVKADEDNTIISEEYCGELIAAAYPERIAKCTEQNGRYRLANGRMASLPAHDPLAKKEWLAIAAMDAGTKEGKIFLAAPLDPADLVHLSHENIRVEWDDRNGILISQREKKIGDIILESKIINDVPEEKRIQVICAAMRKGEFDNLPWNDEISNWQNRLISMKKWRPEDSWPDVSREGLLENIEEWLAPFLGTIRKREDFKKLELKNILNNILSWQQQQKMNELVPEEISVPSGSNIKLQYFSDGSTPVLAVRLQEMFGLTDTPTINEGRTAVLLHLLSPGYKPVQVTQDLRSFWQNTYPDVRKEFRMRYPRHSWPEDPWTAEAARGPRRRAQ